MFLILWGLWVIFNGKLTMEIALLGFILSAALSLFIMKFMDYSVKKEICLWKNAMRLFRYLLVLIWEIIKANLTVIHMILSEEEELEPVLVNFEADMKGQVTQALLANAITLTPGTITVTLEGTSYLVHCLDESLAEGMDTSVFVDYLSELSFYKEKE